MNYDTLPNVFVEFMAETNKISERHQRQIQNLEEQVELLVDEIRVVRKQKMKLQEQLQSHEKQLEKQDEELMQLKRQNNLLSRGAFSSGTDSEAQTKPLS